MPSKERTSVHVGGVSRAHMGVGPYRESVLNYISPPITDNSHRGVELIVEVEHTEFST